MENAYQIVTDSTTDLPAALADKWGLDVIPYIVTLGGKEYYNYLDMREITAKDFYKALGAGKTATTTQITPYRYVEAWEPYLKKGVDVLYLCLSSALSKSFDQCCIAANEMREKYPERKIITIDSKSASLGEGLLALYAVRAKNEGKTIEEAADRVKKLIPRLQHFTMADDLEHLRRGGRVSGTAASVGTMLNIKPLLTITDSGMLVPIAKARGTKKALAYMVEQMAEHKVNVKEQVIGIAHSDAPKLALLLKEMITAQFGFCDFIISPIGPVIGAHAGPGTIAVFFLGTKRMKG